MSSINQGNTTQTEFDIAERLLLCMTDPQAASARLSEISGVLENILKEQKTLNEQAVQNALKEDELSAEREDLVALDEALKEREAKVSARSKFLDEKIDSNRREHDGKTAKLDERSGKLETWSAALDALKQKLAEQQRDLEAREETMRTVTAKTKEMVSSIEGKVGELNVDL